MIQWSTPSAFSESYIPPNCCNDPLHRGPQNSWERHAFAYVVDVRVLIYRAHFQNSSPLMV